MKIYIIIDEKEYGEATIEKAFADYEVAEKYLIDNYSFWGNDLASAKKWAADNIHTVELDETKKNL